MRSDQRAFPVLEGERLAGLVCQRDVVRLAPAQRHSTSVRDVMKPMDEVALARVNDDALDVLNLLAQRDINQVLVVEDGRVAGLVRRADIVRWLALHGSSQSAFG